MSGGGFDHQEYRFKEISDQIKQVIIDNNKENEWGYEYDYSDEVLKELRKAVNILNKAYIYAHRVDYLISGDDGEESFISRLKDDLNGLVNKLNYDKEKESNN